MQTESQDTYLLFVALTRVPTLMGVTQTYFVLNAIFSMMIFLVTKNIFLTASLMVFLHVTGVVLCRFDERFIEILIGKLSLTCRNRSLWKCNSYDPN